MTILAAAALVVCGAAIAAPASKSKAKPAPKAAIFCPVTGQKIASAKAAAGKSTYKGKTYYFCCAMCKPKFDKTPAKYVANAAKGKFERM